MRGAHRQHRNHAKSLFISLLVFCTLALEQEPELPIGIDFGSYALQIATVGQHSTTDLVVNSLSERSTPTAVSFAHDVRAFGAQALSDASRKPSEVFSGPEISQFRSGPFVVNGTTLRAEELVAQSLRNAKPWLVRSPRPVVFTVPASASQRQRRALLHSAELAGLWVDGLVTEALAAGVVRSQDFLATNERTRTEVIVDVGAGHIEICKVKFNREEVKGLLRSSRRIIADVSLVGPCVFDDGVGTLFMDRRLADAALGRFENIHGAIPTGPSRDKARRRLELQAATVRGVLSANHEATLTVESLYNGDDLSMKLTRKEFENTNKDMMGRIDELIGELSWEGVVGIELIGGGSRIPAVQQHIEAQVMMLAGRRIPLGRHLNGDEAASKGAAICASNHSLIVRDASLKGNRRIWLEDGHHRSYSIGWDGSDERMVIAPAGGELQFHREVEMPLSRGGSGILTVFESDPRATTDRPILRYQVAGLASAHFLKLVLRGDQNGIISLSHTKEGDFIEVKLLDFGEMSPPPMQAGELEERKLRLDEWDRRDQDANTVLEALDRLESKMYATRDALDSDNYTVVATDEELNHIRSVLADTASVVETGRSATAEELIAQTEAIDDALSPVLDKGRELESRQETTKWAVDQLEQLHVLVTRLEGRAGALDDGPAKIDKARALLDNVQKWWVDVSTRQERLSLKASPAFRKESTRNKIHRVRSLIEGIARTLGVSVDNLDHQQHVFISDNDESSHKGGVDRHDVTSSSSLAPPSFTAPSPERERPVWQGAVQQDLSRVPKKSLEPPSSSAYQDRSPPKVGHSLLDSLSNNSGQQQLGNEL